MNTVDGNGKSSSAVNKINQEEASEGYLMLACSLISSYMLIRFGRTPISSAIYAIVGCAIGAELLAGALKEVSSDGQTAPAIIGIILNAVFSSAAASGGARSLIGSAVGNVAAGYIAYLGICELYAYLSP